MSCHQLFVLVALVFANAQPDFALIGTDANDLCHDFIANREHFFGLLDTLGGKLADMNEPFNTVFQAGKGAKAYQLGDFHFDMGAERVFLNHGGPWVGFELLKTDADFLGIGVHAQDFHFDFLIFLEGLRGMRDFLRPRNVAYV